MSDKRRRKGGGLQHVGIERRTLKEEHWRGLSAAAKIFYIHLKGRYNGSNNGEIKFPYSAMKDVRDCSAHRTISKAIKELEAKGWIIRKKLGGLYRYNNLYKITFKYDFYACEK
ncbi:MAG: hypothetical protein HQ555_11670 [Candidatus Aminicenantes bacterium]|nr:hypothetical protein [Candidatus Aminicenantes bacterium]